ncbi:MULTISPECIES: hypothetical protein [Cryobacterium]|uniref:hypothetical protein n=1 Tax=Cryobacterium TaxID=69578 RepID=UPI00106BA4F9|nr:MULTISPECIES: hypothetical protein [Cryobacterium]TFD45737.1 hypothetical protein E3T33_06700 [Cryobacterium sp. TMT1-2-1]TFD82952.1 hypothetical protein E3T56_14545 [Cryobacterium psychrotolerans]
MSKTLQVQQLLPPPHNDASCDRSVGRETATGAGKRDQQSRACATSQHRRRGQALGDVEKIRHDDEVGGFGGNRGGGGNTRSKREKSRCLSIGQQRNPFLRQLGCAVPDTFQSNMLAT